MRKVCSECGTITLRFTVVTTPCLCGAFILHHIHNGLTHCLRPLISTFRYDITTNLFIHDIQMKQVTVLLTGISGATGTVVSANGDFVLVS